MDDRNWTSSVSWRSSLASSSAAALGVRCTLQSTLTPLAPVASGRLLPNSSMSQALLPPSGDAVLEGLAVPVAADGDPLPRAVPRAAALDGAAHPGAGVAILPPGEADPHPDLERQ